MVSGVEGWPSMQKSSAFRIQDQDRVQCALAVDTSMCWGKALKIKQGGCGS